ncbi:MAG: type II toxin-antitoxin system Phd/YefM family antitoxin [Bacilli bacterium]|nr:type II toxin-antitoxin system Phd/YefM family antitoxin [Bacilli bacterium]
MDYKNATEFRKNLFASLEKIVEFEEVMTVTTKKGNAVIMSEKEYKGLMETLSLLGQPGFLERIKEVEEGKEDDFVEINAEKGL